MTDSSIGGFVIGRSPLGGLDAVFPPAGPPVTKTIPSYLYQEYNDDDDLQAFVTSFNALAQEYADWFAQTELPVYTLLEAPLLDWVANGLYGMVRPTSLPSDSTSAEGGFNTAPFNTLAINQFKPAKIVQPYITTDDIFQRILTWHLYKGDGKVFSVRWLKRRIMRFLTGTNGGSGMTDATYQISVSFSANNTCTITIISGIRTWTTGALFNRFGFNATPFNAVKSTFQQLPGLAFAPIFAAAVHAGVLELPFQFTFVVTVES